MPQTQAKAPGMKGRLGRFAVRLAMIALVFTGFLWVVQQSSASFDRSTAPAGFTRGVLHGALMPLALPNLALGHDVTIYAASNTGRFYKLGYTVGVNGCGLIFFGFFFWRLNRLRKRLRPIANPATTSPQAT